MLSYRYDKLTEDDVSDDESMVICEEDDQSQGKNEILIMNLINFFHQMHFLDTDTANQKWLNMLLTSISF